MTNNDQYSALNFVLELDGIRVAAFSECSGLNTQTDVIEYRNSSEDVTLRKLPSLKKFTNISLKRGFTDSQELWNWYAKVLEGRVEMRAGSIILLNEARESALSWNFREGWPTKLEGAALSTTSNEVAIETLEIACEEIQME